MVQQFPFFTEFASTGFVVRQLFCGGKIMLKNKRKAWIKTGFWGCVGNLLYLCVL